MKAPPWPRILGYCLLLSMASRQAPAQDEPIQEIVVHAHEGARAVTEFPVSVSAIDMEQMERWNFTSLEDLQRLVPNLKTFSQYAYGNTVSIRGVGSYSRNIGFDERVGLYLDGIYLGPSYGLNQNLLDLEQVEVFRGPQGTLFGRNSIAGAVQLQSMQPDTEFGGQLLLRAGSRGIRTAQGRLTLPLSQRLAFSVSAGQQQRDGLTLNRYSGNTLDNRDRTNARAQFLYTPSDDFSARLIIDGNTLDERMLIGDPLSDTFGAVPDIAAPGAFLVDFNTEPTQSVKTRGGGLILDWALPDGASLQSWTGLRGTDAATRNDTDYSRLDLLHVDYVEDYGHFTEELRFTSPLTDGLRYVLGFNYLDQRGETARHVIAGRDGGMLGMAAGGDLWNAGRVDTRAWSAYASLEASLFDTFDLAAGLRWSRERKQADWRIDTRAAPHFGIANGMFDATREDSDLSPTLSISRDVFRDARLFARYAEGFKSGGYNLDYVSASLFPHGLEFSKETAHSYEAGIKGRLFDARARYSATIFQVAFRDFQVNQFRDLGGGNTIILITNAARVRTRGLEFELAVDFSDSLSVTHTFAVLDARYVRFADGGIGSTDVSGKRLDAPKFAATLAVTYARPLRNDLLAFSDATFSYNGDYYVTADNISSQPLLGGSFVPYGRVAALKSANIRLGIGDRAKSWHVVFWVQNVSDEVEISSSFRDFFGTIIETRGEPLNRGHRAGVSVLTQGRLRK